LPAALSAQVWLPPGVIEANEACAGGGAETVAAAVWLRPSLLAVIVALPGAMPVTTPPVTVAMLPLLVVQVTVRPVSTAPVLDSVVAVSVWFRPTVTVTDEGVMVIEATGVGVLGGGSSSGGLVVSLEQDTISAAAHVSTAIRGRL
jgi:hypothetical protein